MSITVNSFDTSGNAITGLLATVQANGQQIASGYTPITFEVPSSESYSVTIDSYAIFAFDYWSTGSNSPSISITPTLNSSLAAYFEILNPGLI